MLTLSDHLLCVRPTMYPVSTCVHVSATWQAITIAVFQKLIGFQRVMIPHNVTQDANGIYSLAYDLKSVWLVLCQSDPCLLTCMLACLASDSSWLQSPLPIALRPWGVSDTSSSPGPGLLLTLGSETGSRRVWVVVDVCAPGPHKTQVALQPSSQKPRAMGGFSHSIMDQRRGLWAFSALSPVSGGVITFLQPTQ
jgi:hypothetical protein